MENEQDIRNNLQESAVNELFLKKRLILQWGTGVGKSRVAVLACTRLVQQYPFHTRILLLVAERAHIRNWENEFVKFLGKEKAEEVLFSVTIMCYASMHKLYRSGWNMIILDEVHHVCTDRRTDLLSSMGTTYILAMSATPEKAVVNLESMFGRFTVNRYSLDQAIESRFLASPRIYLINMELDNTERNHSIVLDWSKHKGKAVHLKDIYQNRWKYLRNRKTYSGHIIEISCTEREKYEWLTERIDYYKKTYLMHPGNEMLKNMWLNAGSTRKRFLGECKTDIARLLINSIDLHSKRLLCFCSSVEQARTLGGNNAVHSKNPDSQELIDSFNRKDIQRLFAVGMLQEGVTLTDIDAGIIIQLDGNSRGFIQKTGRMLRSVNPVIYVFCIKDTQDTAYLNNMLENIDLKYISYIDDFNRYINEYHYI